MALGFRRKEAGVRPATGSVGDADNTVMAEVFFTTPECQLLNRRSFRNPTGRHSALSYLSPVEYEATAMADSE